MLACECRNLVVIDFAARGIHAALSTADLVLAHDATSEAVGRAIADTGLVAYEISQQHTDLEQAFLHLTTATGAH